MRAMASIIVKTRFAPSPTGLVHLGNLRTALFNVLQAKGREGVFLLRIEDTDQERSKAEFVDALKEDLQWLGLDWQEGPDIGGEHAPYAQSARNEVYEQYYQRLIDAGLAYPCFCSEKELKLVRKSQLSAGQPPRYPGTCARLSAEEVAAKRESGILPTLRFRVPKGQVIEFDDIVRGKQRYQSDDIGDFIIRRSDGSPAFFFTNAVDDALMQVSHVLRGEDHITNTPRQLMLLDALGLSAPNYGHISLIVGDDGSPLSKRNGSMSVRELREKGYLPAAVNNHLARLGHAYAEDPGFLSLDDLSKQFDLSHLGKAPARHDHQQLMHWQQEAVLHADSDELCAWLDNVDALAGVPASVAKADFIAAIRDNIRMPEDAIAWAERLFAPLALDEDAQSTLKAAEAELFTQALALMDEHGADFSRLAKAAGKAAGVKGKKLFMPLRVALTGQHRGPEIPRVFPLIGPERSRERLQQALELAQQGA